MASRGHRVAAYTRRHPPGVGAMVASFRPGRPLALLALGLVLLLGGGCDGSSTGHPASDNAWPAPTLRIVQPRAGARIPLWEEERQLGKLKMLFDVGSTRLEVDGERRYRLLTRIDDRPPTEVRDVHTALIRKPRVGKHVLHAWLEDREGARVAEASVSFEVLPTP